MSQFVVLLFYFDFYFVALSYFFLEEQTNSQLETFAIDSYFS